MDNIILVDNNYELSLTIKYLEDLGYVSNFENEIIIEFGKVSIFINNGGVIDWCEDCRNCKYKYECRDIIGKEYTTIHNILREEKLKRILND